ncbi:protein-ADP-ribose hydrolase [Methanobrevibacter sp.]|uniref:protein-ADP-ribose hydrolase n=1 Tax=Methanobrevibacter sp. TaxID=66852 RepID=UPI0025E2BE09|nr:protein-ADP-ribose hydrolase [Methanobrevibacter sp.]MBQ2962339.1 protein-ADP-ribose hydrolase [Methanobrevibacter sp.]
MDEFDKNKKIDIIIKELMSVNGSYEEDYEIPDKYEDKRRLLRALMNVQIPVRLSDKYYEIQDRILTEETESKNLVSAEDIETMNKANGIDSKIAYWQGDITCLQVDAIVNAANSQMLGCFIPLHNCIDNQIHSAAGFQLRMDCYEIMTKQGHEEPNGNAKITSAYNLPSKYVIHTVGPAIPYGQEPNEEEIEELENCYRSCLELADKEGLKSIAFCSISTGVFNFPKDLASRLAIKTVRDYLKNNKDTSIEKVIFNTFSNNATEIYRKNLLESH